MNSIIMFQNFTNAWFDAIKKGYITNRFIAQEKNAHWQKDDEIEVKLILENGIPKFFARLKVVV